MQNILLNNLLLIDIETVSEKKTFKDLDQQWQQLWEEKIRKNLPDNTSIEDFYEQRAGVMAEFSKIVCISIGYFRKDVDWELRIKSFCDHDEKILLQNFTDTINRMEIANQKWSFTGHNIKEFDIPFLCRRLIINNLPIPSFLNFQNMKPWETGIVDTFQYWRFGDYKNYTSLNLLAASLGIPSPKDDMDGSMVGKVYWEDNNCERIVEYCQKDVITVGNIILRFKNMPLLSEEQVKIISL